ncbi:MAG: putative tryptophan/tyrosine transport system ATP-binding protein [Clostridiales bacterium]|nr:putative tryptophan/tyrosine transport system ATP-binding protein [Clostridiales bacterium]MDN5298036.1 putative tryptophan/tyrosine transport system ATP-binding protein [Clostridiales bacterium]
MLKLMNVNKTFNKGTINERNALDHIELHVNPGDFITIIGSNGAGKSTLFNAICGQFLVDSGQIMLDNRNITAFSDHQRAFEIGRLMQDPMKGTAPNMTIEENLALAFTRKAKRGLFALNKSDRTKFREILSQLELGLEDRMKTKVGQLSGGQRQAVTLIMCTIAEPKLLLLDEHTAALDPETAKKILAITEKIIERDHLTAMMITHDIHAALQLGNRTIMMDDGQIILDVAGEARSALTMDELLSFYSKERKKQLANDRMLFTS